MKTPELLEFLTYRELDAQAEVKAKKSKGQDGSIEGQEKLAVLEHSVFLFAIAFGAHGLEVIQAVFATFGFRNDVILGHQNFFAIRSHGIEVEMPRLGRGNERDLTCLPVTLLLGAALFGEVDPHQSAADTDKGFSKEIVPN